MLGAKQFSSKMVLKSNGRKDNDDQKKGQVFKKSLVKTAGPNSREAM